MTSVPSRLASGDTAQTLRTIGTQTLVPDSTVLCLPSRCEREGRDYVPFTMSGVRVVTPARDYGPLTKLWALQLGEVAEEDFVVTVDDDIDYDPNFLMTLVAAALDRPRLALGFAGWNARHLLAGRGYFEFPRRHPSEVVPVDVAEGYAGVCYRKSFFAGDALFDQSGWPSCVVKQDDPWISAYLARAGVARGLVPGVVRSVRADRGRKRGATALHSSPDWVSCAQAIVQAAEQKRPGTWRS